MSYVSHKNADCLKNEEARTNEWDPESMFVNPELVLICIGFDKDNYF